MINQFLATLDNNPTAPDQFLWPTFTARQLSSPEKAVRDAIIGSNLSRQQLFSRCLQLVALVGESPLAPYIVAADPRVTYTEDSIRRRFGVAGTAVAYTGSNPSPSLLSLVLTANIPDVVTYGVEITSSTTAVVTDDTGGVVTRSFTYSGGATTQFTSKDGAAGFVLTGAAPAVGDSWAVGYQKPGASWIEQALVRMDSAPVKQVLTPDLLTWFTNSQLKIDKLAAVIAALGTA